jgi:DNA-binding transcriptional LysR family regulator
VFPGYREFCHQDLFTDEWVCVVDADHRDVGDALTVQQFSALPYLAITSGSRPSSATMQLDLLGVAYRTEFAAGLGVAPFVLAGTRLVTLLPARLARRFAEVAHLRIVPPPVALTPIHELMLWTRHADGDPAHKWLRTVASDLTAPSPLTAE